MLNMETQDLSQQINMFPRLFTSTLTWSAVLKEARYQDGTEQAAQHRKRMHLRAQLQVVICENLHQRRLTQTGQAYSVWAAGHQTARPSQSDAAKNPVLGCPIVCKCTCLPYNHFQWLLASSSDLTDVLKTREQCYGV